MQTYLFYDIETTGLSKSFDQILQFAAIRTDLALNELERYEITVKRNPDITPAPAAIITHHIGLKDMEKGISEYDAIQQIHRWVNTPGTISIGYNTLGFDDEFLRFSFYRHLLRPYTHQYANNCSRMDLYPMAAMYYLFKPSVLHWPTIDGKQSLKLEQLSTANSLAKGQAHNAMVDVEATLALARHFLNEKEMWDYVAGYFEKNTDQDRSRKTGDAFSLMVEGIFGADQSYQCLAQSIGMHRHYKNQMLFLRLDSTDITALTTDTIPALRIIRKKLGEPSFILPMKDRFLKYISPERMALAQSNQKWLTEHSDVLSQLTHYHTDYTYPNYPNTDAEASIYLNGFWSRADETFCQQFHAAIPEEKAKLTASLKPSYLKTLSTRILARHYPKALLPEQRDAWEKDREKMRSETETPIDHQGRKRLTPIIALQEINELRKTHVLTADQLELLTELEDKMRGM